MQGLTDRHIAEARELRDRDHPTPPPPPRQAKLKAPSFRLQGIECGHISKRGETVAAFVCTAPHTHTHTHTHKIGPGKSFPGGFLPFRRETAIFFNVYHYFQEMESLKSTTSTFSTRYPLSCFLESKKKHRSILGSTPKFYNWGTHFVVQQHQKSGALEQLSLPLQAPLFHRRMKKDGRS